MPGSENPASRRWHVLVVGGHTRSIGKSALVCDLIRAFPEANWVAGKITQYGHGVCAQNGENCDCAPAEHAAALDWEARSDTGTDTARFLAAGAHRSLWLRTKQGFLAEGLPLLRAALCKVAAEGTAQPLNLILESNSMLQFFKPSLYLAVLAPMQDDFKESARIALDRADAYILRSPVRAGQEPLSGDASPWIGGALRFLQTKPCFLQEEGEGLPVGLKKLVSEQLRTNPGVSI